MELINIRDDDGISDLYGAALRGDEQTLQQLLQRDASILSNIPEGLQTPLHISALLGHLSFTVLLLDHDRGDDLAIRADSCGRTALHLASAEGHIDIVKEVLRVNSKTCLNRDVEGRIPLHHAAMRGRTEAVQELIMARPNSLGLVDSKESTAFHLCVIHNHLKTLETLVKLDFATANIIAGHPCPPILKHRDGAGNTILHLAIMLNRVEVVSYLLTISEMKEIENLKNKKGFTAKDILEQSTKDFKTSEIQHMLAKGEEHEGFENVDVVPPPPPPRNYSRCIKMFKCIRNHFMKIVRWVGDWWEHDDEWLKEMRGNLSLVSTVITTMTFQALINPPGGFVQQHLSTSTSSSSSPEDIPLSRTNLLDDDHGQAPVASYSPVLPDLHAMYEKHLFFVTVCFFSSLGVTLLLVSGIFPLKNRAVIWCLSIGMCITLTSLASAYDSALNLIIPSHLPQKESILNMRNKSNKVWNILLEIIILLISLRFFVWAVKKCHQIFKTSRKWAERGNQRRRLRFLLVLLFRTVVIFGMLAIFSAQSLILYFLFFILGDI